MDKTPKPLVCQTCRHWKVGNIECRGCGRRLCKHLASAITDQDGKIYDPIRDARPEKLLGTCLSCRTAAHRKASA